jgi:hypothetical protein
MQKKSKMPKDVAEFRYSSGYKTVYQIPWYIFIIRVKPPYDHKSDFK